MKKLVLFLAIFASVLLSGLRVNAQSANCQVSLAGFWQTTPNWTSFANIDTTVCVGDDISFNVNFDGNYTWSLTSTYPGFVPKSGVNEASVVEIQTSVVFTGTYQYTLTLIGTACNRDTTISITILSPPVTDVVANVTTVCAGDSIVLTADGGAVGSSSYIWTVNGSNIVGAVSNVYSYAPNNGDTINCTISNGSCASTDDTAIVAVVNDNPVAIAVFDDLNTQSHFCDIQVAKIRETNLNSSNIASYSFMVAGAPLFNTSGDSLETWTVDKTTQDGQSAYIVVTDNNGCSDTSNILTINVDQLPDLTVTPTPHNACMSAAMQFDVSGFTGATAGPWTIEFWNTAHTVQFPILNSNPVLPNSGAVTVDVDIPGGTPGVHIKIIEIQTGCQSF